MRPKSKRLLEFLRSCKTATTHEVASAFGVERHVARSRLVTLRSLGCVAIQKKGILGRKGTPATWAPVESRP